MKYSFYPGCSLEASALNYDMSTRAVCKKLGVDLIDIEDWNCCGATAYMSVGELESFAISARNLALAEKKKADLITVCNACYTVLNKTNTYFNEDDKMREKISSALNEGGYKYNGTVNVRHLLDAFVNDVGHDKIKEAVTTDLGGLKVAPYYGCQLVRPYAKFDDSENPHTLDDLLNTLGAIPTPYPMKTKCCGGMLMTTNEDVCLKLVSVLLDSAINNGAQCIATTCPLCYVNLDSYQKKAGKKFGKAFDIPVLYFTQLMGIAFGISKKDLGIGMELTDTASLLAGYPGGQR